VTRAVRRGDAVGDPDLASVAIAVAQRQQWLIGRKGAWHVVRRAMQLVVVLCVLAGGVVGASKGRYVASAVLTVVGLVLVGLLVAVPMIGRRAVESESRNRDLQSAAWDRSR